MSMSVKSSSHIVSDAAAVGCSFSVPFPTPAVERSEKKKRASIWRISARIIFVPQRSFTPVPLGQHIAADAGATTSLRLGETYYLDLRSLEVGIFLPNDGVSWLGPGGKPERGRRPPSPGIPTGSSGSPWAPMGRKEEPPSQFSVGIRLPSGHGHSDLYSVCPYQYRWNG